MRVTTWTLAEGVWRTSPLPDVGAPPSGDALYPAVDLYPAADLYPED